MDYQIEREEIGGYSEDTGKNRKIKVPVEQNWSTSDGPEKVKPVEFVDGEEDVLEHGQQLNVTCSAEVDGEPVHFTVHVPLGGLQDKDGNIDDDKKAKAIDKAAVDYLKKIS